MKTILLLLMAMTIELASCGDDSMMQAYETVPHRKSKAFLSDINACNPDVANLAEPDLTMELSLDVIGHPTQYRPIVAQKMTPLEADQQIIELHVRLTSPAAQTTPLRIQIWGLDDGSSGIIDDSIRETAPDNMGAYRALELEIPAASIPVGTMDWFTIPLGKPHNLFAGKTYWLVFKPSYALENTNRLKIGALRGTGLSYLNPLTNVWNNSTGYAGVYRTMACKQ